MSRKLFWLSGWIVLIILSVLGAGHAQQTQGISQTPGQVTKFDDNLNLVDSVITESTGNIGIGTVNPPISPLEVSALNSAISVGSALGAGQATGLQFLNYGTQHAGLRWSQGSNSLILEDASVNHNPTAWYSGNPVNFIVRNGSVGIGTTSPQATFHVAGGAIVDLSPSGGGRLVIGNNPNDNKIYLEGWSRNGLGNADEMLITGRFIDRLPRLSVIADTTYLSGNVGIGTYSPTRKLDVQTSGFAGVHGETTYPNGNGVEGVANNGTNAWGVYGASTSGYAGYFSGKVHVNGQLSKSSGSFKIDHPLDPANKYLYHSFVESPDMMNLYNGVITLDDRGEATVTLPEWFGALNRDYRYQLTCIGGFAPVYIAEEISDQRFKIAGGQSGLKVSWQVTGIRQDAYANAYRIAVEEDKPASERGFYLHPELHGQPEEKGIEWAQHPETMRQMKEARQQ